MISAFTPRWNLNRRRFINRRSNLPIPQVATRPLSLPAKDATRTPNPKPLTHHHLGVVVVSTLSHAQHPVSNTPCFSPTRSGCLSNRETDCSSNTAVSIPTNNTIPPSPPTKPLAWYQRNSAFSSRRSVPVSPEPRDITRGGNDTSRFTTPSPSPPLSHILHGQCHP